MLKRLNKKTFDKIFYVNRENFMKKGGKPGLV
jgi:hypothetical protein